MTTSTAQAAVARMLERCSRSPFWMSNPESWVWRRADGIKQGFGEIALLEPGEANLLWLSMDLGRPPARYDARNNTLYLEIMTSARTARLSGQPLLDVAALVSLSEFEELLPSAVPVGSMIERAYPVMKALARMRLADADA